MVVLGFFENHPKSKCGKMTDVRRRERRYDKGERRFKHVGTGAHPDIEFDNFDPKKWIGKCPNNISDDEKIALLAEAVAAPNGDRLLDAPKRLYVVHEGAIYEAQTSDSGVTYHAYPYRGKLSAGIYAELSAMAKHKRCIKEFRKWVKRWINLHGEKR